MNALADINWVAVVACVVIGQVFLTLWFAVVFARPWAIAYGVADPKDHTRAIPLYTYAMGAGCVLLLSIGLNLLQSKLGVTTVLGGLGLGAFVAIFFMGATALPGYAFLKRWRAFALAIGSQAALILILSAVLSVWPG